MCLSPFGRAVSPTLPWPYLQFSRGTMLRMGLTLRGYIDNPWSRARFLTIDSRGGDKRPPGDYRTVLVDSQQVFLSEAVPVTPHAVVGH